MAASEANAQFRIGHSEGDDWRTVAAHCLAQIGDGPERANFGWLYVSDHFAGQIGAIHDFLAARLGISDWVGTVGIGVCATGTEYFDKPAMAVMATQFPRDSVRLFNTARQGVDSFAAAEGGWLEDAGTLFGMIHGDPTDGASLRRLPTVATGLDAFLVGGLTSSRNRHPQVSGGVNEGGLSGVLFSDAIAVTTGLSQGCTPIGPAHEISESKANVAVTLDGRPAFEVFCEDIGEILARDLRRVSGYIFAARPVSGTDWGDYMVRNLTGIDPDGGLIAVGDDLSDGGQLMFCRRDRATAEADLRRMLQDVKRRLPGPPRGAVYHSCLARGPNMFERPGGELGIVAEELGEIPLVGFFGNGEVSNGRLYTYTGVLTVFT